METERKCKACEKLRPLSEFYIRKDTGRPRALCVECTAAKNSVYYAENTERHHAAVNRRYKTVGRFERYGITAEIYQQALARQGGCCALCKATKPGGKGEWHIDHRHVGPKVNGFIQTRDASLFRGVLCHRCNIAVGHSEKLLARVGAEKLRAYLTPPDGGALNAERPQTDPG